MTEQDWLEGTDPDEVLGFVFEKTSRRKIELYTSGCYRSVWHSLPDERVRHKMIVRDRYFDGLVTATDPNQSGQAEAAVNPILLVQAPFAQDTGWTTLEPVVDTISDRAPDSEPVPLDTRMIPSLVEEGH